MYQVQSNMNFIYQFYEQRVNIRQSLFCLICTIILSNSINSWSHNFYFYRILIPFSNLQSILIPGFQWGSCDLISSFMCNVLQNLLCPFVFFLLAIVLSVLLRFTDSDFTFGIFQLFLWGHPTLMHHLLQSSMLFMIHHQVTIYMGRNLVTYRVCRLEQRNE